MGRRTRTLLPTSNQLLIPKTIKPKIVQSQLKQQSRQRHYYDQHTKQLSELNKGDKVKIQTANGKWRSATITKVTNAPRSYIVTTLEGSTYRRNRRHINQDHGNEDSYLSDDDGYSPIDASDSNADHQVQNADPNDSNQCHTQSPTHDPSSDATSAPNPTHPTQ